MFDLRTFLDMLNDTTIKTVLLFIGGLILRRWPEFVNKAIPTVLLVLSAALAALRSAFPEIDATSTSFAFTSIAGFDLYAAAVPGARTASWLWNTLGPLAFAIAIQSGSKNTAEWLRVGGGLLWPSHRVPRK